MSDIEQYALIYCRVSSKRQKTSGSGLESQEHRCRTYAAQHGYQVEKIFPDDMTGTGDFMQRPSLMALLDYLKKHPDKSYVVIIDDLKRLARDTISHIQLRMLFRQHDAQIECPNFKFDDSPEGQFIETLFAAQGELEAKQGKRQTIQKMKARLEAGYWVFFKPFGYDYQKAKGGGKILVKNDIAPIITEALEGFACGRFQSKTEVRRFLESFPEFPTGSNGKLHPQRVEDILTRVIYAGYIESEAMNVSRRKGQHEPLISLETFNRVQERLQGRANVPARKDLNKDFPLRGAVVCADCGKPMTACWSKGKTKHHPYYYCYTKGCVSRSKSIRREVIEGEFEELLKSLSPSKALIDMVHTMFKELWKQRKAQQSKRKKALHNQLQHLDRQAQQLLDRILEASVPSIVTAYEEKIKKIEEEKLLIHEKIAACGKPIRPYNEILRTSVDFISNPHKLWASEGEHQFENRRIVLKLAFLEKLEYRKGEGFRTPQMSLPFKVLGDFYREKKEVAEREGFEPSIGVNLYTLSRGAPSATRPSLQITARIIPRNFEMKSKNYNKINVLTCVPRLTLRSYRLVLDHAHAGCAGKSLHGVLQLLLAR